MKRPVDERCAGVERLLAASGAIHSDRARFAREIADATGLTAEGVELGFASLEREATGAQLRAFVGAAGDAGHVHVILSANVFVAPLRAVALARAAAEHVTIRPSARDGVLARALVAVAADPAILLVDERDVTAIPADRFDVYGSDETIAAVRRRVRAGTIVRAHGAGMGLAVVTDAAVVDPVAHSLAADVVPFDQRGCLSPRVVIVEGDQTRGASFARALHERLAWFGERVPRGELSGREGAEAAHWRDTLAFAGRVWVGDHHAVGLAPSGAPFAIPPPGRYVHVVAEPTWDAVIRRMASIARFVVAVGTDAPRRLAAVAPPHARLSRLGQMQHPPLDGPVDRRSV